MKIPKPIDRTPDVPPLLRDLCDEIVSFRCRLLQFRAGLLRPGYHLDVNMSQAVQTSEFLSGLSGQTIELRKKISRYREITRKDCFQQVLITLGFIARDPLLVFAFKAQALHWGLSFSEELYAAAVVQGTSVTSEKKEENKNACYA